MQFSWEPRCDASRTHLQGFGLPAVTDGDSPRWFLFNKLAQGEATVPSDRWVWRAVASLSLRLNASILSSVPLLDYPAAYIVSA